MSDFIQKALCGHGGKRVCGIWDIARAERSDKSCGLYESCWPVSIYSLRIAEFFQIIDNMLDMQNLLIGQAANIKCVLMRNSE